MVQPIVGMEFSIEGGAQSIRQKTDANGCLYWNDSVSFNYLGKEQYIQIERKIVAEHPHRGEVVLDLAVDPWKASGDALVDLRYGSTQALGSEADSSVSHSKLLIQQMQARFYNQQFSSSGLTISGQFSFKPMLARTGYDGREIQESLTQGDFQLELVLIEKPRVGNPGEPHVIGQQTADVHAASAFVETQVDFHLDHAPSQYSTIELGFKVSAKDAASLASEDGLLEMDQLIGQGSYPKEAVQGGLDAYVQKLSVAEHAEVAATSTAPSPQAGAFQFDSVHVEFGGVEKTSKNENVPIQIGVEISACIKSSVDLKPIFNFPFEVSVCSNAEKCTETPQSKTSDPQGCLHWQDHVSFDYFSSEKWIARHLVVHSEAAPFKEQQSQFTVYMDPWQTGSLFQWDSRSGQPPTSAPVAGSPGAAHLDVTGFTFNYVGRAFKVDSNMNLIVKRKYQFQITPAIRRNGSMNQGLAYDSIKAGRYRLRALLMTSQDFTGGTAEPISLYSGLVDAVNGVIVANVEFTHALTEMPLISSRGQIVFELSDLSKDSALKAGTVSAPFSALDANGSYGVTTSGSTVDQLLTAVPSESSVSELSARGTSLYFRKDRAGSVDDLFHAVSGMNTLGDPGLAAVAESQGAFDSSTLGRLCPTVFPDVLTRTLCRVTPQRYLQAFRFLQVASVTGAPAEVSGDSTTLNVSAFVGYTEAQGHTDSWQVAAHAEAEGGLGIKLLGNGGGISAGVGVTRMREWDRSKTDSQQVSVVDMKSLNVEALSFQIPAKTRRCFAIQPTDSKAVNPGYYFCDSAIRDQRISESWYYISQLRSVSTALQDLGNVADNRWMKIIRGRDQYSTFKKMIEDSSKALIFEHDETFLNAARTFGKSFGGLSGVVPLLSDSNIPGVVLDAQ